MPALTHAQLDHKVEKLVTNGQLPVAQLVISSIGYGPLKLQEGGSLRTAWHANQKTTEFHLHAQKLATQAEADARAAANQAVVSLSETCRTVFEGDEPTLTLLGLTAERETVTGPDGQPTGTVAARPPESTDEMLARWRKLVENASSLPAAAAAVLATAGWPALRLSKTHDLVEAYAQADLAQQVAIQTYQQASDQAVLDTETLRKWYSTAAALCRQAIKDADPTNHQQLLELLDL